MIHPRQILATLLLLALAITAQAQTAGQLAYDIYNGSLFEQKTLTPTEGQYLKWQNGLLVNATAAGGGTWGTITGTLSAQTDLQNALNAKQATGNYLTDLTGDITATGPGSVTATIATQAVTFAKMQHISTAHLLGRHSSGTGDVQQIGIDGGLELQGANLRRSALTGDVTASAGSNSTTIANDAVTYAKMQNVSAAGVLLGRGATLGSGEVQQISLGTGLTMTSTSLSVSNIQVSQIAGILPSDQLQSGRALATISEIVASGSGETGVNQTWRNEQRSGYGTGERLTWFSANGAYVLNWDSTTSTWYLAVFNGADRWTSQDDVDYPWQITNWTTDTGTDPPPTFSKAAFADFVRSNGNGSALTNLDAGNISSGTLALARGGTGLTSAGTAGNVLTSNGTTWTSTAPATTNPAGSGSELQFRSTGTAFGAVTNSSHSSGAITLGAAEALGTTSTARLTLANTSTATSTVTQVSPSIVLEGRGWKTDATAASQTVRFRENILPVNGAANPSATWRLQSEINNGTWTDRLTVDSAGVVNIGASIPVYRRVDINFLMLGGETVEGTGIGQSGYLPGLVLGQNSGVRWTNGVVASTPDVVLLRDAPNTLAQRNGTNAQTFRLYETDSGANDEYLELSAAAGTNLIRPQATGTGTASVVRYHTTTAVFWTSGSGSPESVVTAPVGSLYTRTDGGAGTTLYVKESTSGSTGWIAK